MRPSIRRAVPPHGDGLGARPGASSAEGVSTGRAAGLLGNPSPSKPQFRPPRNAPCRALSTRSRPGRRADGRAVPPTHLSATMTCFLRFLDRPAGPWSEPPMWGDLVRGDSPGLGVGRRSLRLEATMGPLNPRQLRSVRTLAMVAVASLLTGFADQ